MLQMTDVITDPELGAAPFVILRTIYRKSAGESVLLSEDRYETFGSVHPAKAADLLLVPEEYRYETVFIFHSPIHVTMGEPLNELEYTAPDRILYNFRTWNVISVRDWSDSGFCKVLAVRTKEE